MSSLSDAMAREQEYVSALYGRFDTLRARASGELSGVLLQERGTHQQRVEREVAAATQSDRISALDAAEEGLCFGRLDLAVGGSGGADDDGSAGDDNGGGARYVGRIGILGEDPDAEPLLVDWRAPAARPFYTATAAAPAGVRRRRHIRTRQRTVVGLDDDALDLSADGASGQGLVGEAALLAAAAAGRTGHMRDVVETIQVEQDYAIRADPKGVLVVQGGPGTGKTAVALHRVAYLLYTHRERLARRGVLVLGPNASFLRYISQVLPALGETSALLCTLGELFPGVLARRVEAAASSEVKGRAGMAEVVAAAVRQRQQVPDEVLEIKVGREEYVLDREMCVRAREHARATRLPHNAARAVFVARVLDELAGQAVRRLNQDPFAELTRGLAAQIAADLAGLNGRGQSADTSTTDAGRSDPGTTGTEPSDADATDSASPEPDPDKAALYNALATAGLIDDGLIGSDPVGSPHLNKAFAEHDFADSGFFDPGSADADFTDQDSGGGDWNDRDWTDLDPADADHPDPDSALLDAEDAAELRRELAAEPTVLAALDRLWPELSAQRLLDGFFASAERIAEAAPGFTAAEQAALLREPGGGWSAADVPLLDEAAELLGTVDRDTARAEGDRRRRLAFAQGVLDIVTGSRSIDLEDPREEMVTAADLVTAEMLAERQDDGDYRTVAQRAAADRTWTFGHVVVDEAQELSAMAWRLVMRRCPARSMTLVGDLAQTADPAGASSWAAALDPYAAGRWRLAELTVNYRTPAEVMDFAAAAMARIGSPVAAPRSVRCSGLAPREEGAAPELLGARLGEIAAEEAAAVEDGRLAVIVPAGAAEELAAAVAAALPDVSWGADPDLECRTVVLGVRQAKGLEFDAVVVVDPDRIVAEAPRGGSDLYVALTRATRRLTVLRPTAS